MSRLPKPSGLKPPSNHRIQVVKPLTSIKENIPHNPLRKAKSNTNLADIDIPQFKPIIPGKLRRRSKSVADLRLPQLADQKVAKIPPIKPIVRGKPASKTAAPVARNVAVKRPIVKGSDDGAPKPKTRKIPDWDYKSRFNQMNEHYQLLKGELADAKQKIGAFDMLKEQHSIISQAYEELKVKHDQHITKSKTIEHELKTLQTQLHVAETSVEELTSINKIQETDLQNLRKKCAILEAENNEFRAKNQSSDEQIEQLSSLVNNQRSDLMKLHSDRRILHNRVQDLKGNIRVFARIRPALPAEVNQAQCLIDFIHDNGMEIRKLQENVNQITGKMQDNKSEFTFDKVFSPESSQEEVFEELAELVQSSLDGFDVCVFAYGQTGSGKTHTMQGSDLEPGMIPRTVHTLFQKMAELERTGWKYTIQASFLEIYNENLRDLLNHTGQKLEIQFNEGKDTRVTNLTVQPIETASELERFMRVAQNNRATAATNFNEHSSRSHAVTKISIQGVLQKLVYTGSVNLVDLAGSESAKQSVVGERLTETKNINRSLATLGDVICALHNKSAHVPYRNSKLTFLLQSCLGGSSKTLMFVNIAPFEDCFGESISSLRFAAKVKQVKTVAKRNKMLQK